MRYNLLNPIHKALKAICYDTALTIQQTSFQDEDETAATVAKVQQTLALLDMHIHHETDFIHPLIQNYNIDLHRHLQQMHLESSSFAEKVTLSLQALAGPATREAMINQGKSVSESFESLLVFNLILFMKEENVLNEMLWGNCTDEALKAVEQQIIATVPHDILELEMRWMIKSLDNLAIAQWFEDVRFSGPAFVYESLLLLAAKELPGDRFEKILALLEPVAAHAY